MRDNGSISLRERKAAFDKRTAQYMGMGFDRIAAADFVIGAACRLEGPALDIGTGRGMTAIALARRELDVVSIDVDTADQDLAALLAEGAGLGHRIRFACGDASALSFSDGEFGCVAMMDVLHHLLDPLTAFGEIARVLAPSGALILADFSPEGFDLISRAHREQGREHPVLGVSIDVAEAAFANIGMKKIERKNGHYHDVSVLMKV